MREVSSWFCSVLIEWYIEGHAVRIMDRTADGNYTCFRLISSASCGVD